MATVIVDVVNSELWEALGDEAREGYIQQMRDDTEHLRFYVRDGDTIIAKIGWSIR